MAPSATSSAAAARRGAWPRASSRSGLGLGLGSGLGLVTLTKAARLVEPREEAARGSLLERGEVRRLHHRGDARSGVAALQRSALFLRRVKRVLRACSGSGSWVGVGLGLGQGLCRVTGVRTPRLPPR